MPEGFGRLTHLLRAEDFFVCDNGYGRKSCKLECLKNFDYLKSLTIKGLGNLADVDDLRRAQLNNRKKLLHSALNFQGTVYGDHEVLLEAVQSPLHLLRLGIVEYRGKTIISRTGLCHLWCINCENLPPLGNLPSLESLLIYRMKSIRKVGKEFLGVESDISTSSSSSSSSDIIFRKLKSLTLSWMEELEDWDYGIPETGSQ